MKRFFSAWPVIPASLVLVLVFGLTPVPAGKTGNQGAEPVKITWGLIYESQYFNSLNETYANSRSTEKVRRLALLYIMKRNLEVNPQEKDLRLFLNLLNCRAGEPSDSSDLLFREAFLDYGEGIGVGNSFIDKEIPARVEFFLETIRDYHPGLAGTHCPLGFGELAQHVISMGVPDIISADMDVVDLEFKGLPMFIRYTFDDIKGFYIARGLPEIYNNNLDPEARVAKVFDYNSRELIMEKVEGRVYQEVSFGPLKEATLVPFVFPVPDTGLWDGKSDIGALPWTHFRGGCDVWGTVEGRAVDMILEYVFTDFTDTIISGSFKLNSSFDAAGDSAKSFHGRYYSDIFAPGRREGGRGYKDLSLGWRLKDNWTRNATETRYLCTLPEDPSLKLETEAMLISQEQSDCNPEASYNPFGGIPNFTFKTTAMRGDTIGIWFPILNLYYDSRSGKYRGNVEIYLVPDRDIRDGKVTLSQFQYNQFPESLKTNAIIPDAVDYKGYKISLPVISESPNLYYHTGLVLPRKPKGLTHLIAVAGSMNQADGIYQIRATAERKIIIK